MSEWKEVTLGDVIEVHDHKRVPLSAAERRTRKGPYPYYGAQGVIDYIDDYLFDGRYILIPEDGENLRSRKLPIAYFAEGKFWVNNHAHIVRARDGLAVDRFIQSALQASDISGFITGAAQPKLSQANLLRIPLRLPDVDGQRRIASVLDAIDDLIENNRRRIALLEQMAQAIYREWFVHFRYPGHEDDELVHSPLGPIPAGWNAITLGEVAETQYGYTDSATQLSVGPKFLRVMDINKRSYISWPDVPHCSPDAPARYRLAKGDVVIARMADPGKVGIVERDLNAVFASYLVRVRPVASWLQAYYLYFVLSAAAYQEFVLGASTGTTRKSISAKVMEAGPIVMPAEAIMDAFVRAVIPLRAGITACAQEKECLVRMRDLLLPKLVTGAIDVSHPDLDALLEETAA